jgi:hypothetical protein
MAVEVLHCLFIHGPTWDGDVPSKSGRDELVRLNLAGRCEGYQFLTAAGVRMALDNKIDRKKESRRRKERERLTKLDQIEALFVTRDGCAMQAETPRPTVQSLEKLLEPEREDGRV